MASDLVKLNHALRIIRVLLLNDRPTEDGVTPLHVAASQGCQQCIEILLAAGAAIDATDSQQRTPYYLSRIYGQKQGSR